MVVFLITGVEFSSDFFRVWYFRIMSFIVLWLSGYGASFITSVPILRKIRVLKWRRVLDHSPPNALTIPIILYLISMLVCHFIHLKWWKISHSLHICMKNIFIYSRFRISREVIKNVLMFQSFFQICLVS